MWPSSIFFKEKKISFLRQKKRWRLKSWQTSFLLLRLSSLAQIYQSFHCWPLFVDFLKWQCRPVCVRYCALTQVLFSWSVDNTFAAAVKIIDLLIVCLFLHLRLALALALARLPTPPVQSTREIIFVLQSRRRRYYYTCASKFFFCIFFSQNVNYFMRNCLKYWTAFGAENILQLTTFCYTVCANLGPHCLWSTL